MRIPYFLSCSAICLTLSLHGQEASQTPVSNDSLQKSVQAVRKDVDVLKHLNVSGWIQAQFQVADQYGVKNFDGGDFASNTNSRFMIRRGRVKFTYSQKNSQYVLQINATERGVNLTDFYAKVTDPWMHAFSLTAGVMNRPYGFEIQQSSADRETPERSRFTQLLMPNERDLGMMVTFQPAKGKWGHGLKIDAGFFNGTGIAVPGTGTPSGAAVGTTGVNGFTDFDYIKDFIGRVHYNRSFKEDKFKFGIGASHYRGGFGYPSNKVYSQMASDMSSNPFWVAEDTTNRTFINGIAPRIYYGADVQVSVVTLLGTTTLRGEFITGTQSGKDVDSRSPQAALTNGTSVYLRNFQGAYGYFVQRIGKSKHEIAVKYDFYDPNTQVKGSQIMGKLKEGEIKWTSLGFAYIFYLDANVKLMLYYNTVKNEITPLKGFDRDLKDNVFTARVQYRF